MKAPDILIAIPSYDRKLQIETSVSLTATTVELLRMQAQTAFFTVSGCALITHVRNAIVTEFLSRPEKTHLLFIDADMEWSPQTIIRMIRANVPFAAVAYPLKRYNPLPPKSDLTWEGMHTAALTWNVEFHDSGVMTGETSLQVTPAGFAKAVRVGSGLMLLRRDMLETMVSKYRHTQYHWSQHGGERTSHFGLFDLLRDEDDGFVGEDYSFCDRWVKGCGGEIWVDVEAPVAHHGHHRYCSSLKEGLAVLRKPSK